MYPSLSFSSYQLMFNLVLPTLPTHPTPVLISYTTIIQLPNKKLKQPFKMPFFYSLLPTSNLLSHTNFTSLIFLDFFSLKVMARMKIIFIASAAGVVAGTITN